MFKGGRMKKYLLLFAALLSLPFSAAQTAAAQDAKGTAMEKKSGVLIAYYSYSGNTKAVAEAIREKVGGDLFEIKAEGSYPDEYRPMTEQAKKEIQEGFRPKLTSSVADISKYDVIFIGSPNWWGTITPQVSSFLETYDLSGKTVVPFITHGGGGVQRTFSDMAAQCRGCKFDQNGWAGYGAETSGIGEWLVKAGYAE